MKPIKFIDLEQQYLNYQTEIDEAVLRVLRSAQYILGPDVSLFEQEFAQYVGAPYAISCANGTDAIQLALMALDIQAGDEVITSVFSFIAAAEMIALVGAKPVFVDIDERTYNIDIHQIAEKISDKTKAIIPVSLYGQIADLAGIQKVLAQSKREDIAIIEDAAQSIGATYQGQQSGSFTTLATTSFFPSKPLGAAGDAGAILTQDAALAEKLKSLRMHGEIRRYHHQYVGLNSRLDTLQADILRIKLKHLTEEIKARQMIAQRYHDLLQHEAIIKPYIAPGQVSAYAQYSIRVPNREHLMKYLNEQRIPTTVHYPQPLHVQPCFQHLAYQAGDFPVAEKVAADIMSLPMSAFLTLEQQIYIAEHVVARLS